MNAASSAPDSASDQGTESPADRPRVSEDWMAVAIGATLLLASLAAVLLTGADEAGGWSNPLAPWLSKPAGWESNPLTSLVGPKGAKPLIGTVGAGVIGLLAFGIASAIMGREVRRFALGYAFVFLGATLAYVLAGQATIKAYNLEYALWGLILGMVISNTIGTPPWVKPATRTELYIKTGMILLGAGVLFSKLMALGLPGVFIAWIVTPIVLIATFWFGQRILKIRSPSLNMVISAEMSVCGVSAAVATGAACKAKKEELSLAIGISLTFTVVMMVLMPLFIRAVGMDPVIGGAWMGGTIDATGAVVAAGTFLGEEAETVAATIKMIQNILIGVVAFGVAVYWTTRVERDEVQPAVGLGEIWRRFPKFILGFVAASLLFSILHASGAAGPLIVDAVVEGSADSLRGWFFGLAFVSIGLDSNFRSLMSNLERGKPLVLYVVGQTLNLGLTLAMTYLMFEVVFPGAAEALRQ